MNDYEQIISEHVKAQDQLEFELGDTIDIKTSIVLVIIIFLATQIGGFFASSSMPLHWRILQIISAVSLTAAGMSCLFELWPKNYKARTDSADFVEWVERTAKYYRAASLDSKVAEEIRTKEFEKAKDRVANNSFVNAFKLKAMHWAFRFTALSLFLNLTTLLALSSGWRF